MKYQNNKVSDIKITYIGGGSREWARFFMGDLALDEQMCGKVTLYDIDYEAAKNNAIIGNKISAKPEAIGKWEYEAVKTLKDALDGADFVAISIQPGTFEEMESDVHLPERHEIYQSVGDTSGPGGIIRSLRTVPMIAEIAEAIKTHSPHSWVINYTNPMSMCMKTLYHVFPEIKAFGCCHEVFGTQELLKVIVEREFGLTGLTRQDIKTNVLGINHFTWIDKASYKGIDLLPVYKDFVAKNFEQGIETEKNPRIHYMDSLHRVKFDLFQRYGLIAAAGDRHLAEFMPVSDYLKSPDHVHTWNFDLTPVQWRKDELVEKEARSARLVSGTEEITIEKSGEEGILLIKALCGLGDLISNVNIANVSNQITNLPLDAIVETNAIFGRDSIRPIFAGAIPENVLALIKPHVDNHDRILKSALTCDKELVVHTFANDPLSKDVLTADEREKLVEDMIRNTLEYLPVGWQSKV